MLLGAEANVQLDIRGLPRIVAMEVELVFPERWNGIRYCAGVQSTPQCPDGLDSMVHLLG